MGDLERKIGDQEVTKAMCLGDDLLPQEATDALRAITECLIDNRLLSLRSAGDRRLLAKRIAWTLGIDPGV